MESQREGAMGCDMLYTRATELQAMTLGPACGLPSVPDLTLRCLIATTRLESASQAALITKRDLAVALDSDSNESLAQGPISAAANGQRQACFKWMWPLFSQAPGVFWRTMVRKVEPHGNGADMTLPIAANFFGDGALSSGDPPTVADV